MFEILTALGLSFAAGINAYIPMLAVGLLSKFTELFNLPGGWSWLEADWVLILLGALTVVEFLADKIAAVDSVNDVIQTAIRPTSGGMMFTVGSQTESVQITDFTQFFTSEALAPFIIGVIIAIIPHLLKLFIRPLINAATAGMVAPIISFVEDLASIAVAMLAIFFPILVPIAIILLGFIIVKAVRKLREKKNK